MARGEGPRRGPTEKSVREMKKLQASGWAVEWSLEDTPYFRLVIKLKKGKKVIAWEEQKENDPEFWPQVWDLVRTHEEELKEAVPHRPPTMEN